MSKSKSKKSDRKNNRWKMDDYYKNKCKAIKKTVKENVFENAAICDEISETQEKLLIVQEQCKFLTKKLKLFEPKFGVSNIQRPEITMTKKPTSKKKAEKKSEKKAENKLEKKAENKSEKKGEIKSEKKGENKSEKKPEKKPENKSEKKPENKSEKKAENKIQNKNVTTNAGKSTAKRQPPKHRQRVGPTSHERQEPFLVGDVTVYNFGHIVYDTPFYYTDSAIYPAGYYATRQYAHFRNLFSKCTYHCKVIRAGTSPRFEIMDNDKHFKVTGLSTDECHSHLISLINKMLGSDDLIPANRNGDRFFGLSLPAVRVKLQAKPESKFCTAYIPLKSQTDHQEAELEAENDPSVSFEGLHYCLNKFRSKH